MMTRPPTLDKRIATALVVETNTDKSELAALVSEAEDAIAKAQKTIEVERERALDIANDEPDKSYDQIRKAELRIERYDKALPALQARIAAIDHREAVQAWNAQADQIEAERDALATELRELYPTFVARLIDIYTRIDANTAAINSLYRSAPRGEWRNLLDAELKARGLQSYSAHQPVLRDNLKLPDWHEPRKTYPADPVAQWNARAAESAAATIAAMNQKHALAFSPDWHAAEAMRQEQVRQETEAREAELQRRQAEERDRYHKWLLETERKARLGLPADAKLEGQ
jgi:hypothetical protein